MTDADLWDGRYAAVERLLPAEPDAALTELAGALPPGRALDLGAGEGRNSVWLARRGWHVTAVDFSRVALARVRVAADAEGLPVEPVEADLAQFLAIGKNFDLVVLAYIHPLPAQREDLFHAAAGAVAPDGHLFLIAHHLASLGTAGPPDPDRLLDEQRLDGAFPGLEVELLERRERLGADGTVLVDVVEWARRS